LTGNATQDRFLGAILGMAIGDAFGMPVAGWSATTIADWYDTVTDYLPRKFPDGDEVGPGEITDDTEIALCIIESVTAGQGEIDVENIGIRMSYLTRSDSRRWMSDETATALQDRSEQHQFQLPLVDDECVNPDVLARGIPIGLMHSMGAPDEAAIRSDVSAVTRITHGSPLAMSAVEAVARAVSMAARHELALDQLRAEVANQLPDGAVREALEPHDADLSESHEVVATLMSALTVVETATAFEDLLERAVAPGGATDTRAALAAAIYGAHHGSGVIPQRLIDGLESRIFVSLAAPWFYRTIARLRGRAIDFRPGVG
jgi:ADP-ribosyl-[dinitrogen reductase] hydrolase